MKRPKNMFIAMSVKDIAAECANTLKKLRYKKAMNITQSEDEDRELNSDEEDRNNNNQVTSLTVIFQLVANINQLSPKG